MCNIPPHVEDKVSRGLHRQRDHPLCILKQKVQDALQRQATWEGGFRVFDDLPPRVTVEQNFDSLLTPLDHQSRSPRDTYYFDDTTLLRCHTSAHQAELLRSGERAFLVAGDVYRRDTVDASHYPIFHQMEGVRVWDADADKAMVEQDLKRTLESLVADVFGDVDQRWVDASFPFTTPSLELEIFFNDEWLEVLGCGVIQDKILADAGLPADATGWAFGLGLERLAMVLFGIPDIRLFWSEDSRFLSQFSEDKGVVQFQPFSKFPPCPKDMAFWLPGEPAEWAENELFELVRGLAGDRVEDIRLVDEFTNKAGRHSRCYRIVYRSLERTLTNEEVNELQEAVRAEAATKLKVELR